MIQDSPDDVTCQVQPKFRTGTKWSAAKTVQEAETNLQIEDWSHPNWKNWPSK